MSRINAIIFALSLSVTISTQAQYKTTIKRIYSATVKDSFDIYTSTPVDLTRTTSCDLIFYLDANLRSGIELRKQINSGKTFPTRTNAIFIGIGHIGNYHVLRRRDFILPFIGAGDTIPKSPAYGHIREFYGFLVHELIPSFQSSYQCTGKTSIVGHSLGGLFVFYCLFRNEGIFSNYVALSPALWTDKYRIYSFNEVGDSLRAPSRLYLYVGSDEKLNQILAGTERMNKYLRSKNYKNLWWQYKVQPGYSHNSEVAVSLREWLVASSG
jgi:predicted alpha/beta superfamily hydrolase